jgi:hypothetical protein
VVVSIQGGDEIKGGLATVCGGVYSKDEGLEKWWNICVHELGEQVVSLVGVKEFGSI